MIAHRIKLCVFLLAAFTQALRPEDAPRNVVAANVGVITFQIDTGLVYERLLMPHWSLDAEIGFRSEFKDNFDGMQTRYIDDTAMLIVCNKHRTSESLTGFYLGLCISGMYDSWSFRNDSNAIVGQYKFFDFAAGPILGYSGTSQNVFANLGLELLLNFRRNLEYRLEDSNLNQNYTIPNGRARLILAIGYAF